MRRLSGHVFDTYDDVDGHVLRSLAPSTDQLPDFVKTAARLTQDQIEKLSDDRFALVMIDEGRKLKKYATVDRGNTALSVLYLLKQAHLLPPTAVKVAASNLVAACQQHGLSVPVQLKMAAKTGETGISGKSQKPYAKNAKVSKIDFPVDGPPSEYTDNPRLGEHDAGTADVDQRTNLQGTPGRNFLQVPPFPDKEKTAGAYGDTPGEVRVKQKSWRQLPYVDVSGWDPNAAAAVESTPAQQTLIEGNYPIDGYDQVKTASVYFEENWKQFHPRKRHEYCVKLASRMESLGLEVPEEVARYGSTTYAADADSYVESRRGWVHDEFKPALDTLLEKRAQVQPDTFAEALAEFDNMTGLRWHWDAQIPDPWMSTFGPSIEKLAEENWSWHGVGCHVTEEQLKILGRNGHERLTKSFGADFAKEFSKNPKAVFNSLPEPNKLVLARLASDRHPGTYTE